MLIVASVNVDAQMSKVELEKKAAEGNSRAALVLERNYFYSVMKAIAQYEYSESDKSEIKDFEYLKEFKVINARFEESKKKRKTSNLGTSSGGTDSNV